MKYKLTLKEMLLVTLCCVFATLIKIRFHNSWTSPGDFQVVLYWVIDAIGWAVYFWERYRNK